MNPLNAVGLLRRWSPGSADHLGFLGTCFAYRWQNRFVTAAHCIAGLKAAEISVETVSGLTSTISGLVVHPSADVAVLAPSGIQVAGHETEPFEVVAPSYGLGEDVMAFGYSVDVLGGSGNEPVPRLFKGYFQRFMSDYKAYSGFRYSAAELNFACPFGLSGGPVFRLSAPNVVLGLATENLRSTTRIDGLEIKTRAGETERTELHEIISYGTVLMLSGVAEWLDRYCPAPDLRQSAGALAAALAEPGGEPHSAQ